METSSAPTSDEIKAEGYQMRYRNIHELEPDLERECYAYFYQYLKHLSLLELEGRYLGIRRHLRSAEIATKANPALHMLPLGDLRSIRFWLRKELLTVEEFRLRQVPLPPRPARPVGSNATPRPASLTGKTSGGDDFLVRYGEMNFTNDMLEHGAMRIKPASAFKRREMDEARFDDELNKHDFTLGEHATVTAPSSNQSIPVLGNMRYTQSAADYYVLCMSNDFDADLFTSFGDACLVVHDPAAFAKRLEAATAERLVGWHFNHFNIEYYDPYELEPGQKVCAVTSKNFCFAYQKEYRFFWFPPKGEQAEGHIDIQVGPLKDIAEVVQSLS